MNAFFRPESRGVWKGIRAQGVGLGEGKLSGRRLGKLLEVRKGEFGLELSCFIIGLSRKEEIGIEVLEADSKLRNLKVGFGLVSWN